MGQVLADGKDFDGTIFLSGSALIVGRGGVGRDVAGDNGADSAGQLGLVAFKDPFEVKRSGASL